MISQQPLESLPPSTIEVPPEAVALEFPEGFMHMHHLRHFALVDASVAPCPFKYLSSLDDADVGFGLADPKQLFANYEVDTSAEREVLDIQSDDEAGLYVILTIGDNAMRTTANLLAPILLNRRTRVARQLVLSDSRYSTKHPIIASRQQ